MSATSHPRPKPVPPKVPKIPVVAKVPLPGLGTIKIKARAAKTRGVFKLHPGDKITYHEKSATPSEPIVVYENYRVTDRMCQGRRDNLKRFGMVRA